MSAKGKIENAKVWALGDYVDTDVLAPGLYMKSPLEVMAAHCLETVAPEFVDTVKMGDVICAGKNFGMGSSRPGEWRPPCAICALALARLGRR